MSRHLAVVSICSVPCLSGVPLFLQDHYSFSICLFVFFILITVWNLIVIIFVVLFFLPQHEISFMAFEEEGMGQKGFAEFTPPRLYNFRQFSKLRAFHLKCPSSFLCSFKTGLIFAFAPIVFHQINRDFFLCVLSVGLCCGGDSGGSIGIRWLLSLHPNPWVQANHPQLRDGSNKATACGFGGFFSDCPAHAPWPDAGLGFGHLHFYIHPLPPCPSLSS